MGDVTRQGWLMRREAIGKRTIAGIEKAAQTAFMRPSGFL